MSGGAPHKGRLWGGRFVNQGTVPYDGRWYHARWAATWGRPYGWMVGGSMPGGASGMPRPTDGW